MRSTKPAAIVDPVQRVLLSTMRRLPEEVQLKTIQQMLLGLAGERSGQENRYVRAYEALREG